MKPRRVLIAIFLALTLAGSAGAQVGEEVRFAPKHRAYFPRWVWQGIEATIVVVIKNTRDRESTHTVELDVPEGADERFDIPERGKLKKVVTIPAHSETRVAFREIRALRGVKTGQTIFVVRVDGEPLTPSCFIKTVRGTLMPSERGSLAILVTLATVWCVVVAAAMRFLARRGAWREPHVAIPDEAQNIDETVGEDGTDDG